MDATLLANNTQQLGPQKKKIQTTKKSEFLLKLYAKSYITHIYGRRIQVQLISQPTSFTKKKKKKNRRENQNSY